MRLSLLQDVQVQLRRLNHLVYGRYWFPHVPLAFLFALGGLWLLRWDLRADWSPFVNGLLSGHPVLAPRRLPQVLIGCGMLIMGLGLLFRSRVAWVMALMLAATAGVSLAFGSRAPGLLPQVYFVFLLAALLLARARFDRSSVTASTLFALTSVVMLLLYATFGAYYLGNDFRPPITDLVTALYFAIVTTSTVGYGDITPVAGETKLFVLSVIVLGVTVFATSLTAVVAPLVTRSLQRIVNRNARRMKRENHFVVIGRTFLASNTWRELVGRGQAVTRVVRDAIEGGSGDADVVMGDPSNVDVLKLAGVDKAAAVLAMLDDDSENAFVVLAVRELGGGARTVVAVNDARHLNRIRLVQPDVVIAPQILGGELAAMIVCGEQVTSDFVMKRVFQASPPPAAEGPKRD